MCIGIRSKLFNAIQSLYDNLSCTIIVNDFETDWFNVIQGVKQGCVISPTLFSIYVNDLAKEIGDLHFRRLYTFQFCFMQTILLFCQKLRIVCREC